MFRLFAAKSMRLDTKVENDKLGVLHNIVITVLVTLSIFAAPFLIGVGFVVLGDMWMQLNEETGEYFAVSPVRLNRQRYKLK